MHRPARAFVLVAIALACSAAMVSAQATEEIHSEPDWPRAGLSVEVPTGAAPSGTPIEIVGRPADERPAELADLALEAPFYELRPIDLRFDEPVRLTRALDLAQFGLAEFDPGLQGYPVAALFSRDPDGAWSWLVDNEVRFDPDRGPSFLVRGVSDHGGPYLGYLGGALTVVADETVRTDEGGAFRIEAQLHGPPDAGATLVGISAETSDASTASVGGTYEVASFEDAVGVELMCHAPGTVEYSVTFDVGGMSDDGLLQRLLGPEGVAVAVIHTGALTCPG